MQTNQWDQLSDYFSAPENFSTIHADVADNILIAWPSLLKGVQLIQADGTHLQALDYGCGGGNFCNKLFYKGYSVIGCDSSSAMINIAKKNFPNIKFHQCDSETLHQLGNSPFDLITSIMVFPFVDNMKLLFTNLNNVLKSEGVLAFATFNPEYVTKNHGDEGCFYSFETPSHPKNGFLRFGKNINLPVFIRTLEEYDDQIIPFGYKRIFTDTPPFTTQYLAQYKTSSTTSSAEFLILIYRKNR